MEPQEKVESRDSPEEKSPRLDDLGGSVSLTTTESENSPENEEVTDSQTATDTVQPATPTSHQPVDDHQPDPLGQEIVEPTKVSQSSPVSVDQVDKDQKSSTTLDSGQLPGADIYQVKWIGWGPGDPSGQNATPKTGIVTQNINGPCPLLSIVNILLLR